MSDVFISHFNKDKDLAIAVADGLEQLGYSTWYYERDAAPGIDHLTQTSEAIENCGAVLLIISDDSIQSFEVDKEVDWTHLQHKPILPILRDLTWEDFEKRQKKWRIVLGATVGITVTINNIAQAIPRIRQGLEKHGITSIPIDPEIRKAYPYPLASVYTSHLIVPPAINQAYQVHQGLQNIVPAIAKYLTALVLSYYKKHRTDQPDPAFSRGLESITRTGLESWLSLFETVLGELTDSKESLIEEIRGFYYQKLYQSDPVGEAISQLQSWSQLENLSTAPFSMQDFFKALIAYQRHPNGWVARGAVLDATTYQQRVVVLRRGLEILLKNLRFLTDYPLLYVRGIGSSQKLYDGMGSELRLSTMATPSDLGLVSNHVYIWKNNKPQLDLYPLLSGHDCAGCNQLRSFYPNTKPDTLPDLISYSCSHQLQWSEGYEQEIKQFFATRQQNEPKPASLQPVIQILRELWSDGQITAEESKQIDLLAKALQIPREEMAKLKTEVREELFAPLLNVMREQLVSSEITVEGQRQIDTFALELGFLPEVTARIQSEEERLLPFIQLVKELLANGNITSEGQERIDTFAKEMGILSQVASRLQSQIKPLVKPVIEPPHPAPSPSEKHYRKVEEIPISSPPVALAVNTSPYSVFVADEGGEVKIYGEKGLIYRDHFDGRIWRVRAHEGRFLAGTWNSYVYCFDQRHLKWQTLLSGPISAMEFLGPDKLIAGSWEGQVAILDLESGELVWTDELKDAISSIGAAADGELLAVGTYGGQVAVLNSNGEMNWLRDVGTGIVNLWFLNRDKDLLVISVDGRLTRIRIENQEILWQEEQGTMLRNSALSSDQRRLYVSTRQDEVLAFNLNGKLHLRDSIAIPDLQKTDILPFSTDGHLAMVSSRTQGLILLDQMERKTTTEKKGAILSSALSPDGFCATTADLETVTVFQLARPNVCLSINPVDVMQRGRYTRVEIRVENRGDRLAHEISIRFEGPFDFKSMKFPLRISEELALGETSLVDKYSIFPKEEGTLPIKYSIEYSDDYGNRYLSEDNEMIEVSKSS